MAVSNVVGRAHGLMSDFGSNLSSGVKEDASEIGDGSPNSVGLEGSNRLDESRSSRIGISSSSRTSGLYSVSQGQSYLPGV